MKTYSTSKHLVVVFVIVLLLSLPYVFAGKPEKPGTPQEEPVWSVYIPEYISVEDVSVLNGLQGNPETVNEDNFYVFDGSNLATRNFVSDRFNFEIQVDDSGFPSLQVQFYEIEFECTDESGCDDLEDQIYSSQPSGVEGFSKRIWFNFGSFGKSINFTRQKIGSEYPLAGYFIIESELPDDYLFRNYNDGGTTEFTVYDITNHHYPSYTGIFGTVTRESQDMWHIVVCDPQSVELWQTEADYELICDERNRCHILVTPVSRVLKGTATLQPFDLYFVREPAQ